MHNTLSMTVIWSTLYCTNKEIDYSHQLLVAGGVLQAFMIHNWVYHMHITPAEWTYTGLKTKSKCKIVTTKNRIIGEMMSSRWTDSQVPFPIKGCVDQ